MRVLASSLHWLNKWEMEVVSGKISRATFLTEQTPEGLRVTILSALELPRFLLKDCEFSFLLTGKFNQDVLRAFSWDHQASRWSGRSSLYAHFPTAV